MNAVTDTENSSRKVWKEGSPETLQVLDYIPGGIFVYSADDDRFAYLGPSFLDMLGYTEEEFLEKFRDSFTEMVYKDDRESAITTIDEQIAHGEYDTCFYRIEKKDGSLLWVHDEGHLVVDRAGDRWFYVVVVDVREEERRQMAASDYADFRQEILNSIQAGILVIRLYGESISFEAANSYFCDIYGMTREQVLSISDDISVNDRVDYCLFKMVHADDWEEVKAFFHSLREGEGRSGGLIFRLKVAAHPDGWYYYCRCNSFRQADGGYRVYLVITDASQQKARENEFDRLLQELMVTNPNSRCAYRLDLTENLCKDCHGATHFIEKLINASTADELLWKVSEIIMDPEIRKTFRKEASREQLLKHFRSGETRMRWKYRRLTEDSGMLWVETFYNLVENPVNHHVEAIAYTVDIDREYKENAILSRIAGTEYRRLGVITPKTGQIEYYFRHDSGRGALQTEDYGEQVRKVAATLRSREEREEYLERTDLARVQQALETETSYNIGYTSGDEHLALTFCWLDETHREIVVMLYDITDLTRREERHVSRLRRALAGAEAADRAKSEFLSRMSHDMRTPMNAIIGFAKLMLRNAEDPATVRDEAEKILSSGNLLLSLINDVLNMSKIEAGHVGEHAHAFSLRQAVDAAAGAVRGAMETKEQILAVRVEDLAEDEFFADETQLQEILVSVLTNANQYTDRGGKIALRVHGLPVTDPAIVPVVFEVEDSGCGMSEEEQKSLFDPYARTYSGPLANTKSAGFGMPIAASLVKMMGGTISVKSAPGVGSTFTIAVPLRVYSEEAEREAALAAQAGATGRAGVSGAAGAPGAPGLTGASGLTGAAGVPGRAAPGALAADGAALPAAGAAWPAGKDVLEGLHILAAEDNDINGMILTETLKMSGAEVTIEKNGERAYTRFKTSPVGTFDLILLDIRMPVMDGLETARAIRALAGREAKTIPMIAMSANAFTEDVQHSLEAGINAHIPKPLDIDRLREAVAEVMQR